MLATNVVAPSVPVVAASMPVVAARSNEWSTGICDCCDDVGVCCFAYWCFPCFACSTASEFGECFCLPLLDMVCSTSIPGPVSLSMRVAVRNRYGIQGDITGDCVYSSFCNICSWCQMAREIKRRKKTLNVITAQPVQIGVQPCMISQPATVAFTN